jgi:hypothetical protein
MLLRRRLLQTLEQAIARHNPSTSKSRSGWVVFYAGCPIIWASRLQTQVVLLTTEAEYIAMSQSLRDVLTIMFLIQEMKEKASKSFAHNPTYTAKSLKTILAL